MGAFPIRTRPSRFVFCLSILQESHSTPDPDAFEKRRDTPPISIAILSQKHALLLAESSVYTANLYHNTAPICIAILLQKYEGQGSLEHPQVLLGFPDALGGAPRFVIGSCPLFRPSKRTSKEVSERVQHITVPEKMGDLPVVSPDLQARNPKRVRELERPCASQEGASILLRNEGGS